MANFNLDNYIPVNDRLALFYKDFPNGRIVTEVAQHDIESGFIMFKAYAYRQSEDVSPSSTGHAFEERTQGHVNKTSYIENCETSAVGRALALLGYEITKGIASREEMEKVQRYQNMASQSPQNNQKNQNQARPPVNNQKQQNQAQKPPATNQKPSTAQANNVTDINEPKNIRMAAAEEVAPKPTGRELKALQILEVLRAGQATLKKVTDGEKGDRYELEYLEEGGELSIYTLRKVDNKVVCNCEDFQKIVKNTNPNFRCEHLMSMKAFLLEQNESKSA